MHSAAWHYIWRKLCNKKHTDFTTPPCTASVVEWRGGRYQGPCCARGYWHAQVGPRRLPATMKTVALVSGGKDSCYSMLLCQQHGHDIIALANLLPSDSNTDDIDSYMYQTVGHQLISAYAACTGLPLYRRRITGGSHSQDLEYRVTAGDEVEDLYCLLAYIKEHHPEVQAVASGAIASDYQRLRVEEVCLRLGLTSLAYLWHQPQRQLLRQMIDCGIEAVLVKVAALGLDPHKHLGRSLAALEQHLLRLAATYGCNPCGEGGEYETLTLDCPLFTRGRLVLQEWQVVLHSPDSIAPVGLLHPTRFTITSKVEPGQELSPQDAVVVQVPDTWQPATAARDAVASSATTTTSSSAPGERHITPHITCHRGASTLHVIVAASIQPSPEVTSTGGAAEQPPGAAKSTSHSTPHSGSSHPTTSPEVTAAAVMKALSAVEQELVAQGCSWSDSCFVHLYLADMGHFGAANTAYCQVLPAVGPPARACVQAALPAGTPVLLDVLLQLPPQPGPTSARLQQPTAATTPSAGSGPGSSSNSSSRRRVLHVQSISDWAPSCIGPYSQAVACGGLVYLAGQIPLDPGSMTLVPSSQTAAAAPAAAWRTLVSCQMVAVALRSCLVRACLSLTVYLSPEAGQQQQLVQQVLDAAWGQPLLLSSYEGALRHWQSVQGSGRELLPAQQQDPAGPQEQDGAEDSDEAQDELLVGGLTLASSSWQQGAGSSAGGRNQPSGYEDDYLAPPAFPSKLPQPCCVYVTVPALPRGAMLEAQPVLLETISTAADDSAADGDPGHGSSQEGTQQPIHGPDPHVAAQPDSKVQQHIRSAAWSHHGAARCLIAVAAGAAATGQGQLQQIAAAVADQVMSLTSTSSAGLLPSTAATWRCWYLPQQLPDQPSSCLTGDNPSSSTSSSSSSRSWPAALQSALHERVGPSRPSIVVQCVPVISVSCQLIAEECCCVIEALWPSGTR